MQNHRFHKVLLIMRRRRAPTLYVWRVRSTVRKRNEMHATGCSPRTNTVELSNHFSWTKKQCVSHHPILECLEFQCDRFWNTWSNDISTIKLAHQHGEAAAHRYFKPFLIQCTLWVDQLWQFRIAGRYYHLHHLENAKKQGHKIAILSHRSPFKNAKLRWSKSKRGSEANARYDN